jgi:hypothetical protein
MCDADYFDWPYDAHECLGVFRTFVEYEEVEFDLTQLSGFVMKNINNEWNLTNLTVYLNGTDTSTVKFVFFIVRYSGTLFKHVVVPGYVLITFSLLIFWMDPRTMWRAIFCGVNIYLHFGLMDRIWWQFPVNGVSRNVPRILKYMVFMLIFATIIFIQSIFFRVSSIRYPTPPLWIQKTAEFLTNNSLLKHFVCSLLDKKEVVVVVEEVRPVTKPEDADDTVEIEVAPPKVVKIDEKIAKNITTWSIFYRFIDRMMFLCFAVCFALYNGY